MDSGSAHVPAVGLAQPSTGAAAGLQHSSRCSVSCSQMSFQLDETKHDGMALMAQYIGQKTRVVSSNAALG